MKYIYKGEKMKIKYDSDGYNEDMDIYKSYYMAKKAIDEKEEIRERKMKRKNIIEIYKKEIIKISVEKEEGSEPAYAIRWTLKEILIVNE